MRTSNTLITPRSLSNARQSLTESLDIVDYIKKEVLVKFAGSLAVRDLYYTPLLSNTVKFRYYDHPKLRPIPYQENTSI